MQHKTEKPTPAFRGSTLSPRDAPLKPGEFLSTAPSSRPTNLEVTEVGDVLLRRGDVPALSDPAEPLWAHRAIGSSDGRKADGGIRCALQSWWLENVLRVDDHPVEMSVHHGRWRVGRGRFCTLGQSPRPRGWWKANLPWSATGQNIRNAALRLQDDGNLIVASKEDTFWDSSLP
eukprot:g12312.t1